MKEERQGLQSLEPGSPLGTSSAASVATPEIVRNGAKIEATIHNADGAITGESLISAGYLPIAHDAGGWRAG